MNPTCKYADMSVGILNAIYGIYNDRDDLFLLSRIDDYYHFSTIEYLWNNYYPEFGLTLKSYLLNK